MPRMKVVYVIALGLAAALWVAWTQIGSGVSADGVASGDGGIGGVEGGSVESGATPSGWRWSRIPLVFFGTFGGLGLLLSWAVPGLSLASEACLATFGGVGLVVILCPGSKR